MAQAFGIVGLEVMGKNIALNIERNGFPIAVYNRTYEKTEQFMKERAQGKKVYAAKTLEDFVKNLEKPRRILLMVKAGGGVDACIKGLLPLLDKGDIIIDGGNSYYKDTDRRVADCDPAGVKFFGMGVSGGEHGALWGPSLMPGGDQGVWKHLEPVLTKIAAKAKGEACVTYCGKNSAGHFVKMVHNGIEYGDMQLIAEAYDLLHAGLGMSNDEISATLGDWNKGELESFLIEITSKVLAFKDTEGSGKNLVDVILDKAGQKGTGKWTSQIALDIGVPIPTMTAAVDARCLSSFKDIRVQTSKLFNQVIKPISGDKKQIVTAVKNALYCSKIMSYAQGFHMFQIADTEFGYGLNLPENARIWRAGCIIRAGFLDRITDAFKKNPKLPNLIHDENFKREIADRVADWRQVIKLSAETGIATPAFSTSLAYFDGLRRERVPANVIQGQRDFFGSHTYERTDKAGIFHTKWTPEHN
ncbi:MAG: NADP-dependent phosphogluconate dehydrogenase [Planctomycetes bacterium]|nr:NADP-dependent phosphogluconate dehydrogenase [Planctomycetota bacterium]